jgi:hypothetical protein
MAAINFPSGASNGATHYENGKLWTYDGTSWNITTSPVTLEVPLNLSDAGSGSTILYLVGSNASSGSGIALSTDNSLTYNPNTNQLSISSGSLAASGITIGSATNTINTASGNLTLDSVGGTVNINDNLTVSGDLTVNGTTSIVNSTITSLVDPIIVLGAGAGNTHPSSDDNKDRGVEFRYVSGTAKTGFFGFDDSTGKFTFIPDGSNTSEVFSGAAGTAVFATVEGDLVGTATTAYYSHQSGYAITSGIATTSQNINLTQTSNNNNFFIPFTSNTSGSGVALSGGTGLSFNPSTNTLTTGNITANLTGNVTGTATTAQNISISNAGNNANHLLAFTLSQSTSGSALSTSSSLVYNPISNLLTVSGLSVTSGTNSTSISSGAFIVTGGVGITGNAFIGGTVNILNTTVSSAGDSGSGALVVRGGIGVSESVNIGRNLDVRNTATIRSLTSGRVTFAGTNGVLSDNPGFLYGTGTSSLTITSVYNASNSSTGASIPTLTIAKPINDTVDIPGFGSINDLPGLTQVGLRLKNALTPSGVLDYFNAPWLEFESRNSNDTRNTSRFRIRSLGLKSGSELGTYLYFDYFCGTASEDQNNLIWNTMFTAIGYSTGFSGYNENYRDKITLSADVTIAGVGWTVPRNADSTIKAQLVVSGGLGVTSNAFIGGTTTIQDTTNSTSSSTGALVVSGGAGFGKSVNVNGNIGARSGFELRAFNSGDTNYSSFKYTGSVDTPYTLPTAYPSTGTSVLQSTSAGVMSWVPLVSSTATTSENINIALSGSANTAFYLPFTRVISGSGVALSTDSTLSFNPSTEILSLSGLSVTSGTNSTSISSGAFIVSGGIGITGNAFIGGTVNITNSTGSGSSTSGAIVINGGVGISGDTYVGRNIDVRNTATIRSLTSGRVTFAGTNGLLSDDTNFTYSTTTDTLTLNGASSSPNIIVSKAIASLGSSFGIRMINSNNATTGAQTFFSPFFEIMGSAFSPITGGSAYTTRVGLRTISYRGQLSDGLEFPSVQFVLEYSIDKGTSAFNNTFWGSVGDTIPRSNPSTTISGQINGSSYGIGTSSFPAFLLYNDGLDAAGNQITSVSPSLVLIGSEYYVSEDGYKNFQARQYVGPGTAISSPIWYLDLGTNITLSRENLAQPPYTNVITAQRFGPVTISQLIGATSTSYGALVVNGGLGLSGNAFIGGTTTIQNTTNSTSSSTGALVVKGGAGIGQSLSVGGNVVVSNNIFSGGNTFTKSGLAPGDFVFDNNSNDTAGILYYYKNNTNFGVDVYATGTGATRYRIVKDLNESGGSEIWSIDRTGVVYRTGWDIGEVIQTRMYNYSDLSMDATTTVGITSYVRIANINFTPKSSTSYIWIEFNANFDFSDGSTSDDFWSNITVDGTEIAAINQRFVNASGGGSRSGVLFPISARYTNTSTSGIAITVQAKRGTADDSIRVYGSSTSGYMRIQEIGR